VRSSVEAGHSGTVFSVLWPAKSEEDAELPAALIQ
jgi:hypothetical protein